MPALTSLPTFVDGQLVHQPPLNLIPYNIDQLAQLTTGYPAAAARSTKPVAKVILSGSQGIPSGVGGTNQIVTWGTEIADTDGMWSSSFPDHMTINTPGWYRIRAQASWGSAGATERVVQILINGVADPLNVVATTSANLGYGGGSFRHQVVALEHLAAGASIYCGVFQSSGATLNLLTNGAWGTYLTAAWAAPY
ncbi:hypothetical protein [Pseudonocardia sp. T1-2H]|uniref:hypothetical protein n=1 Tax=Pseudonocardia sp. T1-2H TaxID=3128899 RepID=UPI0031011457